MAYIVFLLSNSEAFLFLVANTTKLIHIFQRSVETILSVHVLTIFSSLVFGGHSSCCRAFIVLDFFPLGRSKSLYSKRLFPFTITSVHQFATQNFPLFHFSAEQDTYTPWSCVKHIAPAQAPGVWEGGDISLERPAVPSTGPKTWLAVMLQRQVSHLPHLV